MCTRSIAPMCIQVKDHSRVMCEQLQQLRLQTGLVDLDIVCEDHHINVHKVVMAACSRFFKDQLCKQNIQGPVILRLEDFGLELKRDAVSYIIEFVYRGEVNIPGEKLTEVCQAAHTLGVVGLDHLPVPAETQRPSLLTKEHLQIADESELRGDLNNIYSSFSGVTSSPQTSVGKFSMDINNMNPFFMNNNPMQNEDIILLQTTEEQSRNIQSDQDIIPISFGDTGSSVVSHYQQDKINLIVSETGQGIMPEILPDDGTFHEETIDSCLSLFPSSSAEPQDLSPGKGQEGGGKSGQVSGVRHNLPSLQPTSVTSSEVGMNISGTQTSLQALFEAAEAVVSKAVVTSASLACSPTATVNTSNSNCMPRARGKHNSTMSQGKLRVINQGIHSENIQSPSRQEAGRRRSGQMMTAAQPGQEEEEESEDEDTDSLGQEEEPSHQAWAANKSWTHPVESGDTVVPPVSTSQWNINTQQLRPAEIPVSVMSGKTPSIPWNTPVTLESPLVTVTTVTGARDTPPNVSVSWTQPQTSACPSPGQKTGATNPAPNTAASLQQTVRAEQSQTVELEPRPDPSLDSLSPQQPGPSWKPSFGSDDIMLARKSGIPLALQNKAIRSGVPIGPFQNKRKRKSRCSQDGSKIKKKAVVSGGKKGDLEVRKDLIISQEDLSTENVFQNDESCASTSNIVSKTKEESVNDPSQVVSVSSPIGGVHIKTVKKLNSDAVVAELELGVITDLPGNNLADSPKLYQYSCVNCSMMFSSAAQLKRHTQMAHSKDETLFCQVCPEKCSGKENLKLHLYKTHGIGEIFRCEECNYESPVKAVFLKHLSEHIPQEAIKKQCPKCDKVFKTKAGLKQHLKQHFDESLYSCLVCEFKTPQKLNLVKHTASKHGQDVEGRPLFENFACEFCDFKCIASHMLKNHVMRKHTQKSAMRFQCNLCNYATVEKAALDKHQRFKHTNERPFMCDTCGFSTHTASAMARHKRSHSQAKPHKCHICGHEYADKKRLRDHLYIHSDHKPFKCEMCNYTCRRKDNLTAHIKKQHDTTKKEKCEVVTVPDSTSSTTTLTCLTPGSSWPETITPDVLPVWQGGTPVCLSTLAMGDIVLTTTPTTPSPSNNINTSNLPDPPQSFSTGHVSQSESENCSL